MSFQDEIQKLNNILEMLNVQNFGLAKESLQVVIRQLEEEIEKYNQVIEKNQSQE